MKVRKKPVVVDAEYVKERTVIHTLEGDMIAEPGDYIITGIKGERYPIKADIFQATYEAADGLDPGDYGERDLTADEAWEFLCEWNPTDADLTAENVGGEVHVSFAAIDGINIKDVCWANYELIPEPGYWCGPTLTAALNAAARAVRARKEK